MPLGGEPSGELRQANCLSVLSIDLDLNFYLYNFQFIELILSSLWSVLYILIMLDLQVEGGDSKGSPYTPYSALEASGNGCYDQTLLATSVIYSLIFLPLLDAHVS